MNMIPDIQCSLLCDDVRQERNGKFILIGLFESIGSVQWPVRYPSLAVFTRWCGGEGEYTHESRLVAPDGVGVVMKGQAVPVRLKDPGAAATVVEVFRGVELKTPGDYSVEILLDGDLKLRYPLHAVRIQSPAGGGAAGRGAEGT